MLEVSDRFLAALRESHTVNVVVSVYRPGEWYDPIYVDVIGGNVSIDRDAQVRRQATVDIAFTLNEETKDVIRQLPFGGYARVERGIRYADGTVERVILGQLRVEAVAWDETVGQATLTLADRMAQIQDERFTAPWVPTGKPSNAAVQCVYDVFADTIAYRTETDPNNEPDLVDVVYDEDRAAALADLAAAANAVAYFNNIGEFVITPKWGGRPVAWTLDAGDRGVLVAAAETLSRTGVVNGVLVRGQSAADEPPFTALAVHADPESPVRWGGPFGRVAKIETSAAYGSQSAADAAAAAELNSQLGLHRTVTLVGVPNPALEAGDAIRVVYTDGRLETLDITALNIGLDAAGTLELTTTGRARAGQTAMFAGDAAWRQLRDADLVEA